MGMNKSQVKGALKDIGGKIHLKEDVNDVQQDAFIQTAKKASNELPVHDRR